jgi:hypothetical protein
VEELSALQISEAAPTIQESYRELLGYLRNNLHRMNYPKEWHPLRLNRLASGWRRCCKPSHDSFPFSFGGKSTAVTE